ncbi:hypothetical protein BGZ46_000366 [Entomortierella lignicola]|nr:hypothetical protein BGZ46_000366 [Entomortierella lignicola]
MTRKEFDEFDRVEDVTSKPTTPSTARTCIDGSVTEHTLSSSSVSSSTTLGSGYPFTDSSAFWSSFQQYRKMLTQSLQYAIERLNQKGVYSNVITFCAKILAICFFKLPGVAFGLLHALPASRSYIIRMAKAMNLTGENCGMPQIMSLFPDHLSPICFVGTGTWWREFEKQRHKMNSGEAPPPMEMYGNWVRRWQSDDSELFFAFYRHYHHCLAQYLERPLQRIQAGGWGASVTMPRIYAGAPGYLYLSAFFLTKIEGLVHREIHPVTTIVQFEPNANGNGAAERDRAMASVATGEFPGSSAPPAVKLTGTNGGADAGKEAPAPAAGKPKVLDMASRRFVETIVAIMEDHGNIYGAMLDIWIKAVVTKTSVYDVESVFCLLDFLDMLIAELESRECIRLYDSELSTVPLNAGSNFKFIPIHVQFILSTLHILLTGSDHTVTLVRTISFIYQNFSLLTSTVTTLEQLTLGTLLSPDVFEKCFLHWARNVRLYYMRCLVWRVAKIGGGVGILPGWKSWNTELSPPSQTEQRPTVGGMASSVGQTPDVSTKRMSTREALESMKGLPVEQSLSLIIRNILEVMEKRVDMVKRQYAGELDDVTSPRISDKGSAFTPESAPSSPAPSYQTSPDSTTASISSTGGSSPKTSSLRQRSLSDGMMREEEIQERVRAFYQLKAKQVLSQQVLALTGDGGPQPVSKDKSKKSTSRSSLIGRKFKRLGRMDSSAEIGQGSDGQQRNSFDSEATLYNHSFTNLAGSNGHSVNKRASTGSLPLTAGSLFRWMFLGGQGNKLFSSGEGSDGSNPELSSERNEFSGSHHSLASFTSTSSSGSLTMQVNNNDQGSEGYRHGENDRSHYSPQLTSSLRYGLDLRKYPEHLNTYATRSIIEHSAVLNEYVEWLTLCHTYGVKTRTNSASNGLPLGVQLQGQSQPGGVPGIGLGPGMSCNGDAEELFGRFSVFSLRTGSVVEASAVAGHQGEWISPGMAQMMMLRFPGLIAEWPKFWNNSRDISGPPPGPITAMPALAVVNNPIFSIGKGNASGVGAGVGAGAGGAFGGASLNGFGSGNGPSSLRHQQQAQMHHQQQTQLWSRNAAVAAATSVEQSAQADTMSNATRSAPVAVSN